MALSNVMKQRQSNPYPLLFRLSLVQCVTAAFFTLSFIPFLSNVSAFATSDLKEHKMCVKSFQHISKNISALQVTNFAVTFTSDIGEQSVTSFKHLTSLRCLTICQALHVSASALCQLIDFTNSIMSMSFPSSLRPTKNKLWSKNT